MSAKITIERILRDDDDASGQTIREWALESESGFVTVRGRRGDGFLLMRADDIDIFTADLRRAKDAALSLCDTALKTS